MTTLALAVDADDELWTLDDLPTPEAPYVEVESELIEVRSRFPSQIYTLTGETLAPKIRVRRGIAGTTKASHIQGSTLTPNYGLGSGGGGGAIAVTGTDASGDPIEIAAATGINITGAPISDEGGGVVGVAVQTRLLGPFAFTFATINAASGVLALSALDSGIIVLQALVRLTQNFDASVVMDVIVGGSDFGDPEFDFGILQQVVPAGIETIQGCWQAAAPDLADAGGGDNYMKPPVPISLTEAGTIGVATGGTDTTGAGELYVLIAEPV